MKHVISLFFLSLSMNFLCHAQHLKDGYQNKGEVVDSVKWIVGLHWDEVKARAKTENKYIFVDCFTTWCGPCRRMDFETYPKDSVVEILNDKFICVRAQMDRTDRDNQLTINCYEDAAFLAKEFRITLYPTYLFFSPGGGLVSKEVGFKNVSNFIKMTQIALLPGRKTMNPNEKYDSLMNLFRKGNKNYYVISSLIKTALEIGESKLVDSLNINYKDYLMTLDEKQLYQKGNIAFLASIVRSSKDQFFSLFYHKGKRIDDLMDEAGYSQRVIDRVIRVEDTNPFIDSHKDDENIDWNILFRRLRTKYGRSLAEYALLSARTKLYQYKSLTSGNQIYNQCYLNYFIHAVEKYGVDRLNISLRVQQSASYEEARDITLNEAAWNIFLHSNVIYQINQAIAWMVEVIQRSKKFNPGWEMATKDTYANLLYKIGKTNEALELEKGIVEYAKLNNDEKAEREYQIVVNKMSRGEPTW